MTERDEEREERIKMEIIEIKENTRAFRRGMNPTTHYTATVRWYY